MTCTSTGIEARNRPDSPPVVNNPTKPSAYSIGASKLIWPRYSEAVQLNTLIADGTAMMKDRNEKIRLA